MIPVMGGVRQFGLYGYGCGMFCGYCDAEVLLGPSVAMWMELEQLEAGSLPRRVSQAEHDAGMHWGANCRCPMFPQVDPPPNLA
jgi:hypothetical protein